MFHAARTGTHARASDAAPAREPRDTDARYASADAYRVEGLRSALRPEVSGRP